MIINHNMGAINAHRQMTINTTTTQKSTEKLSSGLRINRAGDDAAGLAISEKMRGQIRGLDQAGRNAQDGISLIQTAEGALNETHSILQRMRELAVQSANDTNTDDDRAELQKEITQLQSEVTRISTDTEFNTKKLLDGTMGDGSVSVVKEGVTAVTGVKGATTAALAGMTFTTQGNTDELNGYEIELGTVANGTAVSASVSGKKITINGSFTTGGTFSTTADIQNALNAALKDAGISARVSVTGTVAAGTAGDKQSIANGATEVKAVKGEYMSSIQTGKDVTIDDVSFAKDAFKDLDELVTKINANTTLNAKYVASNDNGKLLLTQKTASGTAANPIVTQDNATTLQIGANAGQTMAVAVGDMSAKALGVNEVNVKDRESATKAIDTIDAAITNVSAQRASLGAIQNRLEHTINNLGTSSENLTAAESRIRDVDMAKEMMQLTKMNVLSQASQAMLAQANQKPNQVLSLLQ